MSFASFQATSIPPTGAVNDSLRPKISKTKRQYGLRPRGVVLSRTVGTAPDTFKKYYFLPLLTKGAYNGTTYAIGATVNIATVPWTVVAKVPEEYN
jgi:hypothetical protein